MSSRTYMFGTKMWINVIMAIQRKGKMRFVKIKKRKEKKREKSDGLTETNTKNRKINQLKTEND